MTKRDFALIAQRLISSENNKFGSDEKQNFLVSGYINGISDMLTAIYKELEYEESIDYGKNDS